MNINDYSFHDSTIHAVSEAASDGQIVDYIIDFPIDWDNNRFEKRTLRFVDVITHFIEEIPFSGRPCILEVVNHRGVQKTIGLGRNEIIVQAQKLEMITNAGKRIIEFRTCDFI